MNETWGMISSIVGAVSGLISLFGIIYFFAIWRGKVDTSLSELHECSEKYPPAEMWTMVKTLWDVYVMDALRHRTDLAEHGSGYKLKKEGRELIPDYMISLLNSIKNGNSDHEDIATGFVVVNNIGLEKIRQMAEEKNLSLQESVAILSTYLDEHVYSIHD